MRKQDIAVILVAVVVLTSPVWSDAHGGKPDNSGGNCQYAQIVDRCGKGVFIVEAGNPAISYTRLLDEGDHGNWEPRGVAYSTVPEGGEFYSFVTQGPYLHVMYQKYYNTLFVRTISLVGSLGLDAIQLTGVHAAPPVEADGKTTYPLYLVGNWLNIPYVLVLDQETLMAEQLLNPSSAILDVKRVCLATPCYGQAVDIAASGALSSGGLQQAFASVLKELDGETVQRFYRFTLQSNLTVEFSIDPWNDEGVPFEGNRPTSLGLDYESLGLEAHGVFQTSSVLSDLDTGVQSCELGPGDLTDVAIWGPNAGLESPYVEFVTAATYGTGILLGFPEDVCPYTDPPAISPGALVETVDDGPLAVALSSRTHSPLWVYTANESGSVSALRVEILRNGDTDTIVPLDRFDMQLGGCPTAISFRDESYDSCMVKWDPGFGDPPPFDEICDVNPDDPWCVRHPKEVQPK